MTNQIETKEQVITEMQDMVIQMVKPQEQIFFIKGVTPLITNKFSDKAMQDMEDAHMKKAKKGHDARNPQQEFEDAKHRCADGSYGFPAIGFKQALVRASKSLGHKMSDTRVNFHIIPDCYETGLVKVWTPSHRQDPKMRRDVVKIGNGVAMMRYRPEFLEWEVNLKVRFLPNSLSADQMAAIIQQAGFGVGIGEWRPEKGGSNGMFEINWADMQG